MHKSRTITSLIQNKDYVPGLKVAGKYMENLDFNYGDKVEVYTEKGLILITKKEAIEKLIQENPNVKTLIEMFSLV